MVQIPRWAKIVVAVLVVLIVAYIVYSHMKLKARPSLILSGFGYANSDGNYTWTGKVDATGSLIFLAGPNLLSGQAQNRILFLKQDGSMVIMGKYEGDLTAAVAAGGTLGRKDISAEGLTLVYDPKLLTIAKKAPKV